VLQAIRNQVDPLKFPVLLHSNRLIDNVSALTRLDAKAFKPSRSHRQCLHRFNRFILDGVGEKEGTPGYGRASETALSRSIERKPEPGGKGKGKGKHNAEFDLCRTLKEAEYGEASDPVRKLTIELESGDYSDEKYELYKRYQMEIHHDTEAKASQAGFTRFLCSPVIEVRIALSQAINVPPLSSLLYSPPTAQGEAGLLSPALPHRRRAGRLWRPRYPSRLCLVRVHSCLE
jgi:hypothetical protein